MLAALGRAGPIADGVRASLGTLKIEMGKARAAVTAAREALGGVAAQPGHSDADKRLADAIDQVQSAENLIRTELAKAEEGLLRAVAGLLVTAPDLLATLRSAVLPAIRPLVEGVAWLLGSLRDARVKGKRSFEARLPE